MVVEIKDWVHTSKSIDELLDVDAKPKPLISFIGEITSAKDSGSTRSYNLRVADVNLTFQYRPEEYNEALCALPVGSLLYIANVRLYRGRPLPKCYDSPETVIFTYRDALSYYKFAKRSGCSLQESSEIETKALETAFQSFRDRNGATASLPQAAASNITTSSVSPAFKSTAAHSGTLSLKNAERILVSGEIKPPLTIENITLEITKQVGIHTMPSRKSSIIKAVFQVNDGTLDKDCLLTAWVASEVYEARRKFTVGMRYQFGTLNLKLYRDKLDVTIDTSTYINASEHYVGATNAAKTALGDFSSGPLLLDDLTRHESTIDQTSKYKQEREGTNDAEESTSKRARLEEPSSGQELKSAAVAAVSVSTNCAIGNESESDSEGVNETETKGISATQQRYADASQNFD